MMALVDLAKNGHFPGALKARVQRERERGVGGRGGRFRYGSLKHQSGLCE